MPLDEVNVSKADLNSLIMNYLIIEGYQSAAQRFSQEADINPNFDLNALSDRMVIKSLIHDGDIQAAIEKINDYDPELLDINPALHFALLRLHLIELIRKGYNSDGIGDIQPALDFAASHLAQRAPSNPQFLADLEKTMALLCFPPDNLVPQLRELMDIKLRRKIAEQVNEALLKQQGLSGESKIKNLVKLWGWGEELLKAENVKYPTLQTQDLF